MEIFAKIIKGLNYKPLLCRKLNTFSINGLEEALSKEATFILKINDETQIAVSWWVSAKRTRSYPYTRVYDLYSFSGKKVVIIPIIKDEGKGGDRDYLQWDTISLMSLLGVYVIIAYYKDAIPSNRYKNKITEQRFDIKLIKNKIEDLLSYHTDALHWNLSQADDIGKICKKALEAYGKISKKLGIEIHSQSSAEKRINQLMVGREKFMSLSRDLAERAQKRESKTKQPKEKLSGIKATLTIKNYLGGNYYFTSDEAKVHGKNILLIEGKHTYRGNFPKLPDIKDGLLKMILFTNLEQVQVNGKYYEPISVLKLTTNNNFKEKSLNVYEKETLECLKKEAKLNGFKILINKVFIG